MQKPRKTMVGDIDPEVLMFTVGKDMVLDLSLAEADCIGSAAHVTMLSRLPVQPRLFTEKKRKEVIAELVDIIERVREGGFRINEIDQDIHLAVERTLTRSLGDTGKRIHTARSRNDQIALDLRLYGKEQLMHLIDETLALAGELIRFAFKNASIPMVGRTHMQPGMPSSVGLWGSAHAEALLDDVIVLRSAYDLNDQSPLGSAAGYGVTLDIDRVLTSKLLGFKAPIHNVLHASNARGKCESVILSALAHLMVSLSRLSQDLIFYSIPEMGYFSFPAEYCTGSSIMPQKKNPDVLELVRAKASVVAGHSNTVMNIIRSLPGGYSRDLQETKEPFIDGMHITRSCLRILGRLVKKLKANRKELLAGFTPEVFAADRALELVAGGMTFRDAYDNVRENLKELKHINPEAAVASKSHYGAPGGLDFDGMAGRIAEINKFITNERKKFHGAISRLLGVKYPELHN